MATSPLYSIIYEDLRRKIENGSFNIGEQLPTEADLASEYSVSRITAKKALELLTTEGMITRKRGKGTFVVRTCPVSSSINIRLPIGVSPTRPSTSAPLIGLVIPEVGESYGLQLLSGIERTAHTSNVFVTIYRSYGEQHSEEVAIQKLVELGVHGLLIFPVNGENYNPEILRLHLNGFPLVLVDKHLPGVPVPAVTTDNKSASYLLTKHLLDLGHQNIAFFSPPISKTITLEDRWEGFIHALTECGRSFLPQWSVLDFPTDMPGLLDSGYNQEHMKMIDTFLRNNPSVTAIFATEFQVAVHVFMAAKALGLRVPEDLSIACFDCPSTNYLGWNFTHIKQDELLMGTKAVEILVKQIQEPKESDADVHYIAAKLVLGDSTAKPRR